MKILVIHPGHHFATSDVCDGLCAGLRANGAEVVVFDWQKIVQTFTGFVVGAAAGGMIPKEKMEQAHQFMTWVASADATNVALSEDVDAVIVVNGLLFPPSRVGPLRLLGLPVACIGTESPYFDNAEQMIAPAYTHWFTNERTAVARFREIATMGRAFYLPMAYNPETHGPGPVDPVKQVDLAFVGGGYPERKQLFAGVDWTGMQRAVLGTLWQIDISAEVGADDFMRGRRYSQGSIPNREAIQWYRSATISLNLHRQMTYLEKGEQIAPGSAESLGPRPYEIARCQGGLLLSDNERPEIFDVFGESAATFKAWDSADLERQLRYWLSHPDERERRARDQWEAILPHSWTARAKTVLETIVP